jgi:threonine dehydrogenase-like Zn-dependent dehydrogenase
MRSLTYVRGYVLEWRERPAPTIREAGDVLLRPLAASVCDIDRPIIEGRSPFPGPFAFGHEGVGEIIDVGDAVQSVRPGDLVAVPWHIACGECGRCASGLTAHCESVPAQSMFGIPTGGEWGGFFDDVVRVPFADRMVVPIPDTIDPLGVITAGDNLTLALEVMGPRLGANPDGNVLVLGGGAVGLYQVQVAAALRKQPVTYIDADASRLAFAAGFGATVIEGPPSLEHGLFDLIVDASFNPSWLRRACRMLNPEGQIECLGGYFEDVAMPMFAMYSTNVRFRIARGNPGPHIRPMLDLIATGAVDPTVIYSETIDWQDAPEALLRPSLKPIVTRLDTAARTRNGS